MERRCAIYSRFSSDLQRDSSIEDQQRGCRSRAAREGWTVVENFVIADAAISGEVVADRDALQALLAAAKRRPRPFDCVLIEDTSRLSRNLADQLHIIATFEFYGVNVVSVTQGIDTAQENARTLFTMHGMVDEQHQVALRHRVHRGQEGRVLQHFNPGGRCYGYLNVPIEDPTKQGKYGRPAVCGVRQEIDEREADVVRRIFRMYANGIALAPIAFQLNKEGVPAPVPARNRLRQAWSRYTIREMLFNEKYRGVVVWNRTKKARDPETRRKVSRARPPAEWIRVEAPEMRIVPEELWIAAHKRNAEVNQLGIARLGGLSRTQRSRTYLFSGILVCGACRSNMVIVSGGGKRGYVKYGCHTHKHSGVCDNNWTIRRDRLEEQLLAAIERRVFKAEIIDYAVKQCQDALQRRLNAMRQQGTGTGSGVDALRRQRDDFRLQASRLATAIGVGGDLQSLLQQLRAVEDQVRKLDYAIAAYRPLDLRVTGEQVREQVLKTLMELRTIFGSTEVALARNALRKHVGRLVLTPTIENGKKLFTVSGNVNLIPEGHGSRTLLVARDGIEPPTPAFSGLPSLSRILFILIAGMVRIR